MMIVSSNGTPDVRCTVNRDSARTKGGLDFLGIDHTMVTCFLTDRKTVPPETIRVSVANGNGNGRPAALMVWLVHSQSTDTEQKTYLFPLAVDAEGQRNPELEKRLDNVFRMEPRPAVFGPDKRRHLLETIINPMLHRELQHCGIAAHHGGHAVELIAWVEVG